MDIILASGRVFRFATIFGIGIWGYSMTQDISDIPFSALTMGEIFGNIYGGGIMVGCFFWFFRTPDEEQYREIWARVGIAVIFIVGVVVGITYLLA